MNYRWSRTFSSVASFSSDLGCIGAWVGPRTGKNRRTQAQREDYVLRRLLVAWRRMEQMRFPFTIRATDCSPRLPDFVLTDADNREIGIEVTEAGSEKSQEDLTKLEKDHNCGKDITKKVLPYGSKKEAIKEIRCAIVKKATRAADDWYQVPNCDLLVYENTSSFERIVKQDIRNIRSPALKTPYRLVHLLSGNFVYADVLGDEPISIDISKDYDIDFAEWIGEQVELLRNKKFGQLDIETIMEELTALASSDRRALRSHLRVLLLHLLKWQFQSRRRSRSWKASIGNARAEIEDLLESSPSLKREFEDEGHGGENSMTWAYRKARRNAADETGLDTGTFPDSCPYTINEVIDEDFFPGK